MSLQAEKQLCTKTATAPSPRTEDETERLIHEFAVHQNELEIRNEELLRVQDEFELSRNTYVELYDFAPIGYFTLDPFGLIQEVNLAGAALLGIERGLLLKSPFATFIGEAADREIFSKHRKDVRQNKGDQTCEIKLTRNDGAVFDARLHSVAKQTIAGKTGYIWTTIVDISPVCHHRSNLNPFCVFQ